MSNYVRWSMQSLETPRHEDSKEDIELLRRQKETEIAIAEGRQQGYNEGKQQGYSDGYNSGHEQGMSEGMAEGRRLGEASATQIMAIMESFQAEREHADELIAQDLQTLALDLTRAILKTALPVHPELLLPLINGLVRDTYSKGGAQLHLHPDDLALLKHHMGEELEQASWKLSANPNMERGGCLLETPDTQVDASLSTRWRRLALALGGNTEWLVERERRKTPESISRQIVGGGAE
ncbi:flagellar assembly protein FliH [Candidatus Methylospira mobilis]|uniref:Flagellar assembly protein FliH n=1 Tax=Candidatus Methylospira mobilis TaxID=1808979 RepID=A0A5Q0BJ73_9GAMM|nr:flagellar assembly protein FliH [Candidatus Methylospira mobilis]QFY41866.1 flagellar assembly protein FliH [Candidatus Methylospira mobilis]WNV06743.1 flagellar assembly protein FliH [Candidatus Methylospira mobilis]